MYNPQDGCTINDIDEAYYASWSDDEGRCVGCDEYAFLADGTQCLDCLREEEELAGREDAELAIIAARAAEGE